MDRPIRISFIVAAWLATAPGAALELERCVLQEPGLPTVMAECGRLLVAEDRTRPDGATLELFVARVPARNAAPAEDPLLLIAGGPGQGTVDFYLPLQAAFEPVRADRDLLLVDQRGTGRSATRLRCPLPADAALETLPAEAMPGLAEQCLTALEGDPRRYTTSVAVEDLERLRQALAVSAWNIYGISYGTRVTQHYLRRFPARVRAVVLDGVVPTELALGPAIAANAQAALEALFVRCAEQTACAQRFGDLPAQFSALLARLERESPQIAMPDPLSAEPRRLPVSATRLRGAIRLLSYAAPTVSLLPLLISEAHAGRYAPLLAQAEAIDAELDRGLSFAMHNAVVCTEDVPFFPPGAADGSADTYLGSRIVDALAAICSRWPRGVIDPDLKAPLVSDKPVLMLSGENDPITPPGYAEQAIAAGLSNATHLIGRGQGHGMAGIGCVPRLLASFVEAPDRSDFDAGCLGRQTIPPFFLSFNGPAP